MQPCSNAFHWQIDKQENVFLSRRSALHKMKHNILPLFYKFNENDIDHYYHYHCDYDNYNYNYHDYTIMNTTIIFVIVIVLALFSLPFFYEVKENQTTERKYKIECIA